MEAQNTNEQPRTNLLEIVLKRIEALEKALAETPHPRKVAAKKEVPPAKVVEPKKPHRPHSILEPSDIPAIRDLVALKFPYARIGKLFGVSASAIQAIAEGRTWKDIEKNPLPIAARKAALG